MLSEDQRMMQFAYYGITTIEDEMEANLIQEIITPMSHDEAIEWENQVGAASNQLRIILSEGYEREAWKALGYKSWSEHLRALAERFEFSERHVERLHSANLIERELLPTNWSVGQISESQLRPLSKLDTPEEKREVWRVANETAPNGKPTAVHVEYAVDSFLGKHPSLVPAIAGLAETATQIMSQELQVLLSHESTEWYTPLEYIEAAKLVMGDIDLDPASCTAAQEWIKAKQFYTLLDNGLLQEWYGRVWLNPPYSTTEGQSNQDLWSQRLITEHQAGRVTEGILLVKASIGYNWFDALFEVYPVCLMRGLISFIKSDGTLGGKAKLGSAFFYLGNNLDQFKTVFSRYGRVITPDN